MCQNTLAFGMQQVSLSLFRDVYIFNISLLFLRNDLISVVSMYLNPAFLYWPTLDINSLHIVI